MPTSSSSADTAWASASAGPKFDLAMTASQSERGSVQNLRINLSSDRKAHLASKQTHRTNLHSKFGKAQRCAQRIMGSVQCSPVEAMVLL